MSRIGWNEQAFLKLPYGLSFLGLFTIKIGQKYSILEAFLSGKNALAPLPVF
jgi:hypothetical protein